jgi:hypothetical protein
MARLEKLYRTLLLALICCAPLTALAETFVFEVYVLEGSGKRLLSKGEKQYTRKDIEVTKLSGRGTTLANMSLDLGNGFADGCSDDGQHSAEGVGLWMNRVPHEDESDQYAGLSWELYKRSTGATFKKVQGEGQIRIETRRSGEIEWLTRVEFLDDTVFRLVAKRGAKPSEISHEMLIRKGSVLAFPGS